MKIEISALVYNISMILLIIAGSFILTRLISRKFIKDEDEGTEEDDK